MSDSTSIATLPSQWPSQLLRTGNPQLARRNGVRRNATATAAATDEKLNGETSLTLYRLSKWREQKACQPLAEDASSSTYTPRRAAEWKAEQNEKKVLDWLKHCFKPPIPPTKLDTRRIGFYDLPAEIRNEIASYIFVHNGICPTARASEDWTTFERTHQPPRAPGFRSSAERKIVKCLSMKQPTATLMGVRATQWDPKLKQRWGLSFLATCSQAFHDYHAFLYVLNNFYIAPGTPGMSRQYFSRLNKEHWAMIPRIIVYFGVLDITPHAMISIEYATRHVYNKVRAFLDSPTRRTWDRFLVIVETYLSTCWTAKLKWLRDNVKGKEVFLIARDMRTRMLSAPLSDHIGHAESLELDDVCPSVRAFFLELQHDVCSRIEETVRDAFAKYADGMIPNHKKAIDKFKQWLAEQEEQENLSQRLGMQDRVYADRARSAIARSPGISVCCTKT